MAEINKAQKNIQATTKPNIMAASKENTDLLTGAAIPKLKFRVAQDHFQQYHQAWANNAAIFISNDCNQGAFNFTPNSIELSLHNPRWSSDTHDSYAPRSRNGFLTRHQTDLYDKAAYYTAPSAAYLGGNIAIASREFAPRFLQKSLGSAAYLNRSIGVNAKLATRGLATQAFGQTVGRKLTQDFITKAAIRGTTGTLARTGLMTARGGLMVAGFSNPASATVTIVVIVAGVVVETYVIPKINEMTDDSAFLTEPIKGQINKDLKLERLSSFRKHDNENPLTIGLYATKYQDDWGRGLGETQIFILDAQGNWKMDKAETQGENIFHTSDVWERDDIHTRGMQRLLHVEHTTPEANAFYSGTDQEGQVNYNIHSMNFSNNFGCVDPRNQIKVVKELNLEYQLIAVSEISRLMASKDPELRKNVVEAATTHLNLTYQKTKGATDDTYAMNRKVNFLKLYTALYDQGNGLLKNSLDPNEETTEYVKDFRKALRDTKVFIEAHDAAYSEINEALYHEILNAREAQLISEEGFEVNPSVEMTGEEASKMIHTLQGFNLIPENLGFNEFYDKDTGKIDENKMRSHLIELYTFFDSESKNHLLSYHKNIYLPSTKTSKRQALKGLQDFASNCGYKLKDRNDDEIINETELNAMFQDVEKQKETDYKELERNPIKLFKTIFSRIDENEHKALLSKLVETQNQIPSYKENKLKKYVLKEFIEAAAKDRNLLLVFLLKSSFEISSDKKLKLADGSEIDNPINKIAIDLIERDDQVTQQLRTNLGLHGSKEEMRIDLTVALQEAFQESPSELFDKSIFKK